MFSDCSVLCRGPWGVPWKSGLEPLIQSLHLSWRNFRQMLAQRQIYFHQVVSLFYALLTFLANFNFRKLMAMLFPRVRGTALSSSTSGQPLMRRDMFWRQRTYLNYLTFISSLCTFLPLCSSRLFSCYHLACKIPSARRSGTVMTPARLDGLPPRKPGSVLEVSGEFPCMPWSPFCDCQQQALVFIRQNLTWKNKLQNHH